ncbi:MAG: cupin domain-containing protein [Anaerolineales bacterium]|nr:cupin domain-containing protein [Anaerolineales bacterium]
MPEITQLPAVYYAAPEVLAVFDATGPRPQFLVDSEKLKVLVVGLKPGQQLPPHPEALAVYHFLSGCGLMTVNSEPFAVSAGAVVIAPPGASRGVVAESQLTFLAVKSGI